MGQGVGEMIIDIETGEIHISGAKGWVGMPGPQGVQGISNSSLNRQYLLDDYMNQLGLTNEDLDKTPSEIKSIVRDYKLKKIVE